ncbi:MAG: MBL fold metallo-hydrolase [Lachnospiraceae bacterium]|nr:MBL fold metallo-hydrolase [Lachnospiraceae bacterium]
MKITVLGVRGSIPVEGQEYLKFGGSTSCILVETEKEAIFIDAGTGIINAPDIGDKNITILLTHPHLDHLLGLPFFPYITQKNRHIDFYSKNFLGLNASEILNKLFGPPFWPCTLGDYPADLKCLELTLPLQIGDVSVEGIESNHPGGSTIFKLSQGGKSVVCATDYEYEEKSAARLAEFAKGTDLLFMDAQYTEEELATRKGYGHSAVSQGLKIMQESGAKNLRFVHHDPRHNDEFLTQLDKEVKSETVSLAGRGEVIKL